MDNLFLLAAAAAVEHSEESANLLTQFGVDWKILIAQIINFLIVAFLLYRFAAQPILATMDERQKRIQDGLQYAEEMKSKLAESERQQAEVLREANLEAQKILSQAREQAKILYDKQTAETAAKTADMLEKARATMELERATMLTEVRKEVARLVVATSAKVLARELDAAQRQQFSEAAARELTRPF